MQTVEANRDSKIALGSSKFLHRLRIQAQEIARLVHAVEHDAQEHSVVFVQILPSLRLWPRHEDGFAWRVALRVVPEYRLACDQIRLHERIEEAAIAAVRQAVYVAVFLGGVRSVDGRELAGVRRSDLEYLFRRRSCERLVCFVGVRAGDSEFVSGQSNMTTAVAGLVAPEVLRCAVVLKYDVHLVRSYDFGRGVHHSVAVHDRISGLFVTLLEGVDAVEEETGRTLKLSHNTAITMSVDDKPSTQLRFVKRIYRFDYVLFPRYGDSSHSHVGRRHAENDEGRRQKERVDICRHQIGGSYRS